MLLTAIVGTYRKGGIIDIAVDELLEAAQDEGAEVVKVDLRDKHIEFCSNCRVCTQQAGEIRGACPLPDDMHEILQLIDRSDALVLASPMNFWTVTALMKRFMERLVCFAYWPWGKHAPKVRSSRQDKCAVIIASSAAPALLARFSTRMVGLLKSVARLLGAQPVGVLFVGLAGSEQHPRLGERSRKRARQLGRRLVSLTRG